MNPVLDLLTATQNLIRDPDHWTQGAFARTEHGNPIGQYEDNAVCFCTLGALNRAYVLRGHPHRAFSDTLTTLDKVMGANGIPYFNDNHTHAEVMAAFEKAKELAANASA